MIYTIGHSNRTLHAFCRVLEVHEIQTLVDVRGGSAGSRAHPHFNKANLAQTLPAIGIQYVHLPELGGRRSTHKTIDTSVNAAWRLPAFRNYADYACTSDDFLNGIRKLVNLSQESTVAYMCAEIVPWKCHRGIITDYMLLVEEMSVVHLISETQKMTAKPYNHACHEGDVVVYPNLG